MSKNLEGKKSPNFSGECTSETKFKLSELNKNLVLYFYPKDSTPGCTTESQDFRDLYKKFLKHDTCLLYTSPSPRDS